MNISEVYIGPLLVGILVVVVKSSITASPADPFPEDALRAAVMLNMPEPANAWIEGLRTRIRLMRTAAFMFPALAFAIAFTIARCPALQCAYPNPEPEIVLFYLQIIAAIGLAAVMQTALACCDPIRERKCSSWLSRRWLGTFAPPRTNDEMELDLYEQVRTGEKGLRSPLFDIVSSAFALYLIGLTIFAFAIWNSVAVENELSMLFWVSLLAGIAMSLLALWSWWRTTGTFMSYLHLLDHENR